MVVTNKEEEEGEKGEEEDDDDDEKTKKKGKGKEKKKKNKCGVTIVARAWSFMAPSLWAPNSSRFPFNLPNLTWLGSSRGLW